MAKKNIQENAATTTLFAWFNARISDVFGLPLALQTRLPAETLRQLGAPNRLVETFRQLNDCEIIHKQMADGPVPDLERRERGRKRSTGQFYTPEALAERLAMLARLPGHNAAGKESKDSNIAKAGSANRTRHLVNDSESEGDDDRRSRMCCRQRRGCGQGIDNDHDYVNDHAHDNDHAHAPDHNQNIIDSAVCGDFSQTSTCKATDSDFRGDTLRVLDPACGDGSFLMAVARRLCRERDYRVASLLAMTHDRSLSGVEATQPADHYILKKAPHDRSLSEVEATQETLQPAGSGFRDKECHCERSEAISSRQADGQFQFLDCIHGYDIDLQALLVCLTRLICAFPGCGWPVLEQRDFLLEPPATSFDLVIGNPPYRVNLDEAFKERLAGLYSTGEGEKDLYTFFLEGGLRALAAGGQMIMLTSHTWLVNHQCGRIREHVFGLHQVTDLRLLPARFFASAPGILPVVCFVDKTGDGSRVKVFADYTEENGWQREFSASSTSFVDGRGLRQAIVPDTLRQAFATMNSNAIRLGDVACIGVGIQESMRREGTVSKHVSDAKKSDRHRPVLRGREVAPFAINWEGSFIDYGPHLAYAGSEAVFSGPKILYQNIRNEKLKIRLVAAYDPGGYFPKNSLSFILPESEDYDMFFILGLLNSLPVNAWFSSQFHSFHITVTQMRQVPLPPVNKALFTEVADFARKLSQCETGETGKLLLHLNEAVCRCYCLSEDRAGQLQEFDKFLEQAASL